MTENCKCVHEIRADAKEHTLRSLDERNLELIKEKVNLIRQNNLLSNENNRLIREVEILRTYGNKDCTALADQILKEYEDDLNNG